METENNSSIHKVLSQWKVRIFALLSIFETLLFGGIPYGWGTLLYLLKEEGIYSDLCLPLDNSIVLSNMTTGDKVFSDKSDIRLRFSCTEQDQRFNLWFSISIVCGFTSNVIIGKIVQVIGASKTRIIFMPFFIAGALCLAFTSKDLPWLVLPGLSMLFVGGFSIQISNIRVTSILTFGSFIYIGLMFGSYDTSSIMTRAVKALYDSGISRMYSFVGLAILHLIISGMNTLIHYRYDITKPYQDTEIDIDIGIENLAYVSKNGQNLNDSENTKEDGQMDEKETEFEPGKHVTNKITTDNANCKHEIKPQKKAESIREQLTSSIFCIHTVFISIQVLIFVFFFGSINKRLEVVLNDKQIVEYFTEVLSYTLMGGIIGSFISGSLLELMKKVLSSSEQEHYRRFMPLILPLSIGSILIILLSSLTFIHSSVMFYGLFVTVVLLRSFIYSVHGCFCASLYPVEQVSFLYGFGITVSGLVSLLQYALFVWMNSYDDALSHVNWMLLVLSLVTIIHPINVYRRAKTQITDTFHAV